MFNREDLFSCWTLSFAFLVKIIVLVKETFPLSVLVIDADNLKLFFSRPCFLYLKIMEHLLVLRNQGKKCAPLIFEDFGLNLAQFKQKQV